MTVSRNLPKCSSCFKIAKINKDMRGWIWWYYNRSIGYQYFCSKCKGKVFGFIRKKK